MMTDLTAADLTALEARVAALEGRPRPAVEPSWPPRLTERHLDVLRLLAEDCTNREIAARLYLSEQTVKNHITHLFNALGVSSRAGAVAAGFRRGLLS